MLCAPAAGELCTPAAARLRRPAHVVLGLELGAQGGAHELAALIGGRAEVSLWGEESGEGSGQGWAGVISGVLPWSRGRTQQNGCQLLIPTGTTGDRPGRRSLPRGRLALRLFRRLEDTFALYFILTTPLYCDAWQKERGRGRRPAMNAACWHKSRRPRRRQAALNRCWCSASGRHQTLLSTWSNAEHLPAAVFSGCRASCPSAPWARSRCPGRPKGRQQACQSLASGARRGRHGSCGRGRERRARRARRAAAWRRVGRLKRAPRPRHAPEEAAAPHRAQLAPARAHGAAVAQR